MSLRPLFLTTALCVAALVGAVGQASAEDGAKPAAAVAGEKHKIVVNLAKGTSFGTKTSVEMNQSADLGGMQMETLLDIHVMTGNSVEAVDEKGTMTIKQTVAAMKGKFSNPMMGEMEFDSEKPDDGNPMAAQFLSSVGEETTAHIEPNGKTTVVGKAGADAPPTFGNLGEWPKDGVAVGESWTHEITQNMGGMNAKVKVKQTLKSIDAEKAVIAQDGEITIDTSGGGQNPMASMASKMKIKKSSFTGETVVNRKDGYLMKSDVVMDMEMSMDPDPNAENPMLANGMSMTMKQKVHTERTEAPKAKTAPAATPGTAPAEQPKAPEGQK